MLSKIATIHLKYVSENASLLSEQHEQNEMSEDEAPAEVNIRDGVLKKLIGLTYIITHLAQITFI